jgi:hypothetical protein
MSDLAQHRRVLIMGAAGRDFHNFLCCYRDNPQTEVVACTVPQIPTIAGRRYPASGVCGAALGGWLATHWGYHAALGLAVAGLTLGLSLSLTVRSKP